MEVFQQSYHNYTERRQSVNYSRHIFAQTYVVCLADFIV